jgi:hypothetical protein
MARICTHDIGMQRAINREVPFKPAVSETIAPFRPKSATVSTEDATLEFALEGAAAPTTRKPVEVRTWIALGVAGLIAFGTLAVIIWIGFEQPTALAATGSLRVDSEPPGAEVRIDGAVRGTTPATLGLPVGRYTLTVQHGARVKQVPIEIAQGVGAAYHFAWADPTPTGVPERAAGNLYVASDAPGSVSVDGTDRGQSPLTIGSLTPGRHDVVVRTAGATYRRSVQVDSGATASLVLSAAPAASWGWISVDVPFVSQVIEGGRTIGTSEVDRLMLPPGDHQLDFVSEAFGFRESRRVRVSAGAAAPVSLNVPTVPLSINALPWADVSIDGVRVGDTPLANVMQPIGDHEIVFRHPQLGEKRQVARVTQRESLRISVDMRTR